MAMLSPGDMVSIMVASASKWLIGVPLTLLITSPLKSPISLAEDPSSTSMRTPSSVGFSEGETPRKAVSFNSKPSLFQLKGWQIVMLSSARAQSGAEGQIIMMESPSNLNSMFFSSFSISSNRPLASNSKRAMASLSFRVPSCALTFIFLPRRSTSTFTLSPAPCSRMMAMTSSTLSVDFPSIVVIMSPVSSPAASAQVPGITSVITGCLSVPSFSFSITPKKAPPLREKENEFERFRSAPSVREVMLMSRFLVSSPSPVLDMLI